MFGTATIRLGIGPHSSCFCTGIVGSHSKIRWPYPPYSIPALAWTVDIVNLKGNSTLKNISPNINICDKWSYVSVIKLTMQIRHRRILMIKLLTSRNIFLHGGGSSRPSSLFLYLCLFVDVDMVTKKQLFMCSFVRKNVRCFHSLAGNSTIIRSTSPTLSIRNAFINSRSTKHSRSCRK